MSISVADNFSYKGAKPLDGRLKYDTVANMVSTAVATLYDGCFAYVTGTKKYYTFDSSNDVDPTLGKWREYSGGGESDSSVVEGYLNATDGKFYEESAYTTEIAGEAETLYVTLDTDKAYRYDSTNGFVEVASYPSGGTTGQALVKKTNADNDVEWGNPEDGRSKSTAIAPDFDATATYAIGDRVMYSDELYVCSTAHTGAWDASDFTKSDVDSEIPEAMSAADLLDVKNEFVVPVRPDAMPVLFDETGAERVVGWYKLANGKRKPVYEKCFNVSNTASDETITISTVLNSTYCKMIDAYGVKYVGTSGDSNNIIFPFTNGTAYMAIYQNSTALTLYLKTVNVGCNFNVSVRYTKVADTPV